MSISHAEFEKVDFKLGAVCLITADPRVPNGEKLF